MKNFLQQILFFIATTFSATARPTLPYTFTTKALANHKSAVVSQRVVHLYSHNSGKFVRIKANSIDGAGLRSDPNATLILHSAGFDGQVRIMSRNGSRYLCMSGHGSLVVKNSTQGAKLDGCIFIQVQHPKGYTVYRSKIMPLWYLGIRRNGSPKSAKKTTYSQRATHFLEL